MNPRIWIAALLLTASAAVPAAKSDLDYARLRASLNDLAADPVLGKLAPAERALAEQSVQAIADTGGKEHAHLVYLAERRVDVAYATAQAIDQERRLDKLDREHDQILLAASRHDAEQARLEAEKQRIQSLAQAEEAERLRAEADAARAQGEMNAQDAANARKQAEQTKRLADAQAKEAALSRKEAQLLAEAAAADARSRSASAAPAPAAAAGASKQMALNDSAFTPGAATLRPEARSNVSAIVAFVNRDRNKQIRIEGHTDNGGNANADLVLSQRRAEAVRDALVAAGIDARRITTFGMGQAQPVAPNTTEEGRARNRRVDVILEDR